MFIGPPGADSTRWHKLGVHIVFQIVKCIGLLSSREKIYGYLFSPVSRPPAERAARPARAPRPPRIITLYRRYNCVFLRPLRRRRSNAAERVRRFPLDDLRLDTLVSEFDQPRHCIAAVVLLVLAHLPPLGQLREGAALHHPLQADRSQLGVHRLRVDKSAAEAIGAEKLARIGEAEPLHLSSEWYQNGVRGGSVATSTATARATACMQQARPRHASSRGKPHPTQPAPPQAHPPLAMVPNDWLSVRARSHPAAVRPCTATRSGDARACPRGRWRTPRTTRLASSWRSAPPECPTRTSVGMRSRWHHGHS